MQLILAQPRISNKRKLTSFWVISILLVTLITTSLTACGTGKNATLTSPLPFTVSGNYFELRGYSNGYSPGGTYDFQLAVRNDTDEEWKSNCHVFLVDANGPVLNIADFKFDLLYKGDQVDTVIKMNLPADTEPGAYGFVLLFPQKGTITTTIYVGEEIPDEPVEPWQDITAYEGNSFSNHNSN